MSSNVVWCCKRNNKYRVYTPDTIDIIEKAYVSQMDSVRLNGNTSIIFGDTTHCEYNQKKKTKYMVFRVQKWVYGRKKDGLIVDWQPFSIENCIIIERAYNTSDEINIPHIGLIDFQSLSEGEPTLFLLKGYGNTIGIARRGDIPYGKEYHMSQVNDEPYVGSGMHPNGHKQSGPVKPKIDDANAYQSTIKNAYKQVFVYDYGNESDDSIEEELAESYKNLLQQKLELDHEYDEMKLNYKHKNEEMIISIAQRQKRVDQMRYDYGNELGDMVLQSELALYQKQNAIKSLNYKLKKLGADDMDQSIKDKLYENKMKQKDLMFKRKQNEFNAKINDMTTNLVMIKGGLLDDNQRNKLNSAIQKKMDSYNKKYR